MAIIDTQPASFNSLSDLPVNAGLEFPKSAD